MAMTKVPGGMIDSSGDITITNLTVTGDLSVTGTTTSLETATLNVEDKNITLNYGSGDTSASADGAGITIQDAIDSSNDATFNWGASNDRFKLSHGLEVLTGRVGIGETSPDAPLHITATGVASQGTIKLQGTSSHIGYHQADDTFKSWVGHYNTANHGSNTDLNIKAGYNGGGNIRITADGDTTAAQVYLQGSSGNLGVGAGTSPSERLTIGGGIGTNSSTAFASMGGRLGFGNDYSDTQRGPNKVVLQNDGAWIAGLGISDDSVDLYSGGKFTFLDSAGANSYTTRMVIANNGNVGINNSSPGTLLSLVENSSHTNNRLTIFSSDYNYGQIRVGSSTSEASIGFMRSTTLANTENNSPSGGNNTWAIGLGVWGANFGIGSNSLLDNVVEWDSSGHMLPGTNNTYDLGSTAKGWRNIYTNDLHLSNMPAEGEDVEGNPYTREGNEVDGTNGSWTIQEGADDLYLLNRLNGKKYKFKLEEVS